MHELRTERLALSLGILSARPADAQVTYTYHGNPFTEFSCGTYPSGEDATCSTPFPGYTSYTAANFVTVTLTLTAALPANLPYQDIYGLP